MCISLYSLLKDVFLFSLIVKDPVLEKSPNEDADVIDETDMVTTYNSFRKTPGRSKAWSDKGKILGRLWNGECCFLKGILGYSWYLLWWRCEVTLIYDLMTICMSSQLSIRLSINILCSPLAFGSPSEACDKNFKLHLLIYLDSSHETKSTLTDLELLWPVLGQMS